MSYSEEWAVLVHPDAAAEIRSIPHTERVALRAALEKLIAHGPALSFPHQSAVRGSRGLRELRPRAGRSAWRALYSRIGETFVILAVAPEARSDPRRFARAVRRSTARLTMLQEREGD
jgi:hypothetical protein